MDNPTSTRRNFPVASALAGGGLYLAPAVANAIYTATGKRIRKLPINKSLA